MADETSEIGQISFFLSRPDKTFESVLSEDANIAKKLNVKQLEFESSGASCQFIYFETQTPKGNPTWLDFVNEKIENPETKIKFGTTSHRPNGLLLIKIENRIFAATFGMSSGSILNEKEFEPDFGIRTAMNMCGNEEIRQTRSQNNATTTTHIDRQVSRPADSYTFGLNDSEDLTYISAHLIGNKNITLQGKDNLTIKIIGDEKLNWENLVTKCKEFLKKYDEDTYINLFPNYKNFKPASDDDLAELDKALISAIKSEDFSKMQIAIPQFIPDDEFSFTYTNNHKRENLIYSFLDVSQLKVHLDFEKITPDVLHSRKIYAYSTAEGKILNYQKWSIYRCLVFEYKLNDKYFLLNSGRWMEIDNEFYLTVTDFIDNVLHVEDCENIYKNIDISDPVAKKNNEAVFNEKACKIRPSNIKFDKAQLKIGSGKSNKEFCDILDLEDTGSIRIIHCKPYKDAASINYLFLQAKFYSEAFLRDPQFLSDIRQHISNSKSPKLDEYLDYVKADINDVNGHEYVVCLWLLCDNSHALPTKNDIPLIAQYELKLMHEHLRRVCKFKDLIVRFVPVKRVQFTTAKAPAAA